MLSRSSGLCCIGFLPLIVLLSVVLRPVLRGLTGSLLILDGLLKQLLVPELVLKLNDRVCLQGTAHGQQAYLCCPASWVVGPSVLLVEGARRVVVDIAIGSYLVVRLMDARRGQAVGQEASGLVTAAIRLGLGRLDRRSLPLQQVFRSHDRVSMLVVVVPDRLMLVFFHDCRMH